MDESRVELAELRAIDFADLEHLHRWHNSHEVYATLESAFRFVSRSAEEEWLKERLKYSTTELYLAVCARASRDIIGYAVLRPIDWIARKAEFHIVIGDVTFRSKGYGASATRLMLAHAFGDLGLRRVFLEVLADNAPAIAMYRACGFEEEGRLRAHAYKGGRHVDVVVMGVLAPVTDV